MIYNFDKFDDGWDSDILIVKKEGKNITIEDIKEETPWVICEYDSKADNYELSDILDLSDWPDCNMYAGNEFIVITSVIDKLKYAFASLHNDYVVEKIVKEIFPHVKDIKVPAQRYTSKYYLQQWMDKYKFSLKDFIINDKYMILSCTGWLKEFYWLEDNNLIDWNKIEICSIGDDEDETN